MKACLFSLDRGVCRDERGQQRSDILGSVWLIRHLENVAWGWQELS